MADTTRSTAPQVTRVRSWSTADAAGPTPPPDEATVVRAVLDGDVEAFRWLVDRELAGVVRAAARVLDDVHEAEDVAQEAFVIAYRALATWRGDGPFGAWLARIAIRLAVRRSARKRAVAWVRPTGGPDADGELARIVDRALEPEPAALRGERAMAVRRALVELDEPYRETVALRFFGNRTLEEIATITGRPIGTVKTHLRRGLLRLRAALEGGGEP